jgi:hypothetical protein
LAGGFGVTVVAFNDAQHFLFARELLRRAPKPFSVQVSATDNKVTTQDERLVRLLTRLNTAPWIILPYFGPPTDAWLLTADSPLRLGQAHTRLVRFLSPSYGYFHPEQVGVQRFDPDASELQRLAAPLFPAGYYRWHSRPRDRAVVLDRLMLWLDLEAAEPRVQREVTYTYVQLREIFLRALNDQRWEDAAWALAELGRRHLTTAENLLFSRLQLLAAQGHWGTIWQNEEFPIWAELTVPRPVRSLLLTACYLEALQSFEQQGQWEEGLSAFGEMRVRLGRLLSGPFQIDQPPVARLVIYQAVADQDAARLALLQACDLDRLSGHMLESLLKTRPSVLPSERAGQTTTMLEKAVRALSEQDYATADQAIPQIPDPAARTVLLIELAFHTQDDQICDRAWHAYQSLSFADQEALSKHPRFVAEYLTYLKDRLLPIASQDNRQVQPMDDERQDLSADQPLALRAWLAIGELERRLREVVAARYQTHFADDWEQKLHTDPAYLARWHDMRARDSRYLRHYDMVAPPLLDYTYLQDLGEMIQREWALFEDIFGQAKVGRRELDEKITSVSRIRNPLAHNRMVPEPELERALTYSAELLQRFAGV